MPACPTPDPMPRAAAFSVLCRWHPLRNSADDLLADAVAPLGPRDASLAHHLVEETLRHLRVLDLWIDHLARAPDGHPRHLQTDVRQALRLGLIQLRAMRVPSHAAAHTSVDLAPCAARGLVNAVLRRFDRERSALEAMAAAAPPAVRFSLPDWLWERWASRLGVGPATAVAELSQQAAPVTFVANAFHPAHATAVSDPATRPDVVHPGFFVHDGPIPAAWFADGLVYAMDPGATLACQLLAPQVGESILDACAAPGGKTRMLAELAQGQAALTATDADSRRLRRLAGNMRRLLVPKVTLRHADWLASPAGLPLFDAALVDAPCTNTGVLRRRLDARHRFSATTLAQAVATQTAILRAVAGHVRPGGRMVYSTCSLESEENEDQVGSFLARHPGWHQLDQRTTRPDLDHCDGHFAALLERRA